MADLRYALTAERPDLEFWLLAPDGTLVNFATGYTFVFKIGGIGTAAVFTKTTGITGAAGTGTERSGTPNVTISFTAGELAAVPVRNYQWQITATTGGLDRVYKGNIALEGVIL